MATRKKAEQTIVKGAIAKMVEYQKDSIVSKTLVDRRTGTITLFAFGAKQGLSVHKAPYDAVVIVLDGECKITIAGEPYNLSAGDTITMPANIPHAVRALKRFKMLLIMIKS
jgi:quercetin dioxygenase-like cupin family protein